MIMKKLILLSCLMLFIVQLSQAQASFSELESALGFEEQVNDVPESPIHFIVYLLAIGGMALGIKKLK